MTTVQGPTIIRVECTRSVDVRLAKDVTPEQLVALLNQRQVCLHDDLLVHADSKKLLAARLDAVNKRDYRCADDQSPMGSIDELDIYSQGFNDI